jgi:hypothetical protein
MLAGFDPNSIQDLEGARQAIVMVLNLVEDLKTENENLRFENQRLRDEIHRLKGEGGKPEILPNRKQKKETVDHSSESERRTLKRKPELSLPRQKRCKVATIQIDREVKLEMDPKRLPPDAIFKGYEPVVVQDIKIETDTIRFHKAKYYSPEAGKTYLAELPPGYEGEFGPGVKSLAIVLYFSANLSEPKIEELFAHAGLHISAGQLSNFLIKDQHSFHAEKDALYLAGLHSSPWQHLDDTSTRVNGQNQHCHIICNPLYTVYFTTEKKDRLTLLDGLMNFQQRTYQLNAEASELLQTFRLPQRIMRQVEICPQNTVLSETEFMALLEEHLPALGSQQRQHVLEAAAIAAYHTQVEFPHVRLLVCDDAPQFKGVTEELQLCWIHEGRHYKKLTPWVDYHRQLLKTFLGTFWDFYDQLLVYRTAPTPTERERLAHEFDELFSTVTGYDALDERIAKTKTKKNSLLTVLNHPEIPLHNNPAELGARQRVRKRDVSFGPRTRDGTKAWDTFMSLAETAKKLGVNFIAYIHDRVSGADQMPPLADLITQRAQDLQLGASWAPL